MFRRIGRRALEKILAAYGYDLIPSGSIPRGFAGFVDSLSRLGFSPGTVIDIGVADGTPWLYDGFPNAKLVLVEPNEHYDEKLKDQIKDREAEFHSFAAGSNEGVLRLNILPNFPSSSSLLELSPVSRSTYHGRGEATETIGYEVAVRPLDSLPFETYPTPLLVKIDTEGFELEVIRGAEKILQKTDLVIAECSVLQRFEGGAVFSEIVAELARQGFDLFEIIEISDTAKDRITYYMDIAFIARDSAFGRSVLKNVSGP